VQTPCHKQLVAYGRDGWVVWITGLPASGKSTLAKRVFERLVAERGCACILDGDAVRAALVPPPSYDPDGRDAFYATLAQLAALLASQGMVVLVPATAHHARYRDRAERIAPRFLEVFVDVPLEECARRDPKGLYRKAYAGEVATLPGAHAAYEPPTHPGVVAHGGDDEEAADQIVARLRG
jgi:adenylylsulfate kinase